MMRIPFRPGHLAAVEPGAEERADSARFGPGLMRTLAEGEGPAWSLINGDGRILGCFGMHNMGREGIVWVWLSDELRKRPILLHRTALRCIAEAERLGRTDRMLTIVRGEYKSGLRWIRRLGFAYDGDIELKNIRYRRYVKWHQQQSSQVP